MSGHSKWATTKHKKAVVDATRGKMFAKLIKNIEVAARMGGGDISGNPTLYDAIQKAKKSSVPNDNIDRAVKRGSGRRGGRRRLHDDHVRGLRPRRRRDAHRVPHRQQEPRRHGGPHRDDPQRRLAGRPGLGVVPLQPQGRRARARPTRTARRSPRTTSSRRRSTPAPRTSTTWASPSRSSPRPPTWSPCAPRSRPPASTTTPPRPTFVPDMQVELDKDGAAQDVPPDRGARGLRRRAERLRQLRRLRRGHGASSTPEPCARPRRVVRRTTAARAG